MGRLPFDPDKMKSKPPTRAADAPMSVSAFARMVERAVSDAFPKKVTVRGEVSGVRHRTHWYFNLKDEQAVIGAVMFASAAKRSAVRPADGRVIVATGKLEYYAPQGRLSLIVESIAEDGQGSLEARFRALCDDFRSRGWFDADAKKAIPAFPRRIAVVTADGSAAMHDVVETARQRCPAVELALVDVPVQGERAAGAIVRTIRSIDSASARLGIDAILLTRGGGSVEDLWCFNDPNLAEAIHRCGVPIVAAIGHESDTTIAELVADHRSATPTQAAVRLTPDRAALSQQLGSLDQRRSRAIGHMLELERRRVEMAAARPVMADPAAVVWVHRRKIDGLSERLNLATRRRLEHERLGLHQGEIRLERQRPHAALTRRRDEIERLRAGLVRTVRARLDSASGSACRLGEILHAVDPRAVLGRGYSITMREDGTIVREPGDASPGSRISTRLAGGEIVSRVEADVEAAPIGAGESEPAEKRPAPRRRPKAKPAAGLGEPPPQLDLFAPGE